MSELNLTRKTFLEVEELNRFQEFLQDGVAANTIVSNTAQFGIIQDNFTGTDVNFQVSQGTASGSIQFTKARSQALDIDGRVIRLLATDNIAVADDSAWYWVRISHTFRRHEVGTVSVNANGNLTGVGTLFNEVLRGQATDVPVRISFQELDGTGATNNGTYEVVNIIDDTNAVLTSTVGFQAETDLRYVVIGSLPIGEIATPAQLTGIYQYDSCNVELVAETTENTPPVLPANGANRFFYVARVMNVGGTVTIQDRRDIDDTYWKFNVPGITGAIITRALPAPSAINQYMLVGRISFFFTNFVRLFWQGCGQNDGTIIDIRFNLTLSGTDSIDVINTVLAGDPTHKPRFYHVINTDTLTYDLYAQSSATTSTDPFLPGYVAFVGENLAPGGTGWVFADTFSWSNTAPTQSRFLHESRFAVYSNDAQIEDVNDQLSTLTSNVSNALVKSQNLSDVASVQTSRTNLGVLSQNEVQAEIDTRVGTLVYSARIYQLSGLSPITDITVFKNADGSPGNAGNETFIETVNASGNRYQFTFTVGDVEWRDKLEVQATSGGNGTSSNPNRNPHIIDFNTGDGFEVYLADSGGNDQYGIFWIRVYRWSN